MYQLSNSVLVLGGDGYLGWSVALALANRTDDNIVIVDNMSKRKWELDVGVESLVKLDLPQARVESYKRLYRRNNLSYESIDLLNYDAVHATLLKYRPKAIINAAQQPSAPFSMMSSTNARITFDNNSTTNLNVVWAIGAINSNIKYISLGSAGSYLSVDSDFIPKEKVDFRFSVGPKEYQINNSWLPMQASDIYHQSKINSFLLNDLCATTWGLKAITVQQSTIFGHTIAENFDEGHHALSTRFNYDHVFGTVLNRFVCQAVIGHPLSIYGDGKQKTGLISLSDAVDNFVRLVDRPLENGKHVVEHNFTCTFSINEMAKALSDLADIEVHHLKNPRLEPRSTRVKEFEGPDHRLEINNRVSFRNDLKNLLDFAYRYKGNINIDYIAPTVDWVISKKAS